MPPFLRNFSLAICVAGASMLLMPGCLPSGAPEPAPAPAAPVPTPTPAATPAPAAPAQAPAPGQASLHFDSRPVEDMNAPVTMTPLPDGTGFQLVGAYDLKATLVRGAADQWVLQGTLQFPTGGFAVGEPSLMAMGDVVIHGNEDVKLQESTSHVLLQIPIQLPAAGAAVTQAVEEVKLNTTVAAPHAAEFMVLLVSG